MNALHDKALRWVWLCCLNLEKVLLMTDLQYNKFALQVLILINCTKFHILLRALSSRTNGRSRDIKKELGNIVCSKLKYPFRILYLYDRKLTHQFAQVIVLLTHSRHMAGYLYLGFSWIFSVPPGRCRDSIRNFAMTASLHTIFN
jgi:hypothetical protein